MQRMLLPGFNLQRKHTNSAGLNIFCLLYPGPPGGSGVTQLTLKPLKLLQQAQTFKRSLCVYHSAKRGSRTTKMANTCYCLTLFSRRGLELKKREGTKQPSGLWRMCKHVHPNPFVTRTCGTWENQRVQRMLCFWGQSHFQSPVQINTVVFLLTDVAGNSQLNKGKRQPARPSSNGATVQDASMWPCT